MNTLNTIILINVKTFDQLVIFSINYKAYKAHKKHFTKFSLFIPKFYTYFWQLLF